MKEPRPESGPGSGDPLARDLVAGEPSRVRQVRRLVQKVVRFRGYYIPADERADVVQEVMLEVWRSVSVAGAGAPKNLEALVRSIAYRRCVDWLRRRRAAQAIVHLPEEPARRPDAAYLDAEQRRLGSLILERVRPSCRELFRLHAVLQLSYRQIGERLGRSEGALRTQMSECLKEAREIHRRLVAAPGPGGVPAPGRVKEARRP